MLELGETKKAIYYFDKALMMNPLNGLAMFNKGISSYLTKDYEEAIRCYNEALILESEGEISAIWCKLGLAYYELEEYKKSVESFENALNIENKLLDFDLNNIGRVCFLLSEKARSLLGLKRTNDALECSERMLKLQPENPEALKIRDLCLRKLSKDIASKK